MLYTQNKTKQNKLLKLNEEKGFGVKKSGRKVWAEVNKPEVQKIPSSECQFSFNTDSHILITCSLDNVLIL